MSMFRVGHILIAAGAMPLASFASTLAFSQPNVTQQAQENVDAVVNIDRATAEF